MDASSQIAERLLDAQVAHHVAELVEDPTPLLAEVLDAVRALRIGELADPESLTETLVGLVQQVGPSPAIDAMIDTLVPVLRDLPANAEHRLGDVVDRSHVEAVVDVLARSEQLRGEAFDRVGRSPAMATIAMRFVGALVGDAVQQNRERAEKLPGMKLAFGMGDLAARQARGLAPKRLEQAIGGAADKGAQAAMDRVIRALSETLDVDLIRLAIMEIWDLHADDAVDTLRSYLTDEEIDAVVAHLHAGGLGLAETAWLREVVRAAVEGFVARYEDATVGALLDELGLDDAVVTAELTRYAPRLVAALHRDGLLEGMIRRRLEPFYRSPSVERILGDATGPAAG